MKFLIINIVLFFTSEAYVSGFSYGEVKSKTENFILVYTDKIRFRYTPETEQKDIHDQEKQLKLLALNYLNAIEKSFHQHIENISKDIVPLSSIDKKWNFSLMEETEETSIRSSTIKTFRSTHNKDLFKVSIELEAKNPAHSLSLYFYLKKNLALYTTDIIDLSQKLRHDFKKYKKSSNPL